MICIKQVSLSQYFFWVYQNKLQTPWHHKVNYKQLNSFGIQLSKDLCSLPGYAVIERSKDETRPSSFACFPLVIRQDQNTMQKHSSTSVQKDLQLIFYGNLPRFVFIVKNWSLVSVSDILSDFLTWRRVPVFIYYAAQVAGFLYTFNGLVIDEHTLGIGCHDRLCFTLSLAFFFFFFCFLCRCISMHKSKRVLNIVFLSCVCPKT